jgi:hypothetical protein
LPLDGRPPRAVHSRPSRAAGNGGAGGTDRKDPEQSHRTARQRGWSSGAIRSTGGAADADRRPREADRPDGTAKRLGRSLGTLRPKTLKGRWPVCGEVRTGHRPGDLLGLTPVGLSARMPPECQGK